MPNPSTITEYIESKTRLVIIHDTDADGTAAAWCISQLKDQYGELLLIPQQAGVNEIPEGLTKNDSVFLVDRSYPWDTLLVLSQQVHDVTVIDHHISAMIDVYKEAVASGLYELTECVVSPSSITIKYGNLEVHIDTNNAACMLSWGYQIAHSIDPDPASLEAPWFIQYIEDRDLWTWKLPNSKAVNAGIYHFSHVWGDQMEFYSSSLIGVNSDEASQLGCMLTGQVVLQTQLNIIKSIAHGPTVRYMTHVEECWTTGTPPKHVPCYDVHTRLAVVCVPFSLISDFGDYMLNCIDPNLPMINAVLAYNRTEEGYVYGVRSKRDMLWLAKAYGGGGHPRACGFKSQLPPEAILDMWK